MSWQVIIALISLLVPLLIGYIIPRYKKEASCRLFKKLSKDVWNKVIRTHAVNLDPREIGITTDLITEILHFHTENKKNISVYAKEGKNEGTYGSDMDVFVEVIPGLFRWYALQAKVLKKDKKYNFKSDPEKKAQWERLEYMEQETGCLAYYLLYNGMENRAFKNLKNECGKGFKTKEFGCSLVSLNKVASAVREEKSKRIHFDVFHPLDAEPWHILACCPKRSNDIVLYELDDIKKAKWNYKELSKTGVLSNNFNSNNSKLTNEMERFEWDPDFSLVFRLDLY